MGLHKTKFVRWVIQHRAHLWTRISNDIYIFLEMIRSRSGPLSTELHGAMASPVSEPCESASRQIHKFSRWPTGISITILPRWSFDAERRKWTRALKPCREIPVTPCGNVNGEWVRISQSLDYSLLLYYFYRCVGRKARARAIYAIKLSIALIPTPINVSTRKNMRYLFNTCNET